jgi:predicted ATPase
VIGRGAESAMLRDGLERGRLVTVTGAAGVGKSTLAATAVTADGVPWRRVVRVRCPGGGPAAAPGTLAALVPEPDLVRDARRTLLLVDDADAVHAECAGLVQRLLMTVPGLRVLVTSRRALGLGDERVLRLGPLPEREAVRLLLARTGTEDTQVEPQQSELTEASRICRLLEGVPLAVELAAGELARGMSPGVLADRLERDQCWLAAAGPDPRGHRSLRAAVGAGYVLSERAARVVWSRASVLAGPFTEATAVYLCAGAGVEPDQVPSCLAQLAADGVLEPVGEPGGLRPPRYRMARAARDFGAERLRDAGELPVARERHLLHHRRLAEAAGILWGNGDQRQAAQLVRDHEEDVTALIGRALTGDDVPAAQVRAALGAMVDLWFWWAVHERGDEGRTRLLRLLSRYAPDDHLAARARWLAAWLSAPGDPATARTLLGRAWPAAVRAGDDALLGRIAHVQGVLAWERSDAGMAAECFRQAAAAVPPDAFGGPPPSVSLAALAVVQAGPAPLSARRTAHRALAWPGVREDAWAVAVAQYARACVDHHQGRDGRAWTRARRALAVLDRDGDAPQAHAALHRLLASIESGTRSGLAPLFVPPPRTGAFPVSSGVLPVSG